MKLLEGGWGQIIGGYIYRYIYPVKAVRKYRSILVQDDCTRCTSKYYSQLTNQMYREGQRNKSYIVFRLILQMFRVIIGNALRYIVLYSIHCDLQCSLVHNAY